MGKPVRAPSPHFHASRSSSNAFSLIAALRAVAWVIFGKQRRVTFGKRRSGRWRLQFEFDTAAWQRLVDHRLGRTVLLTNRIDWSA